MPLGAGREIVACAFEDAGGNFGAIEASSLKFQVCGFFVEWVALGHQLVDFGHWVAGLEEWAVAIF